MTDPQHLTISHRLGLRHLWWLPTAARFARRKRVRDTKTSYEGASLDSSAKDRVGSRAYDALLIFCVAWFLFSANPWPSWIAFMLANLGALLVFDNVLVPRELHLTRRWDVIFLLIMTCVVILWPLAFSLARSSVVLALVALGALVVVRVLMKRPRPTTSRQKQPHPG